MLRLGPGFAAAADAVCISMRYQIIHDVQAGASADDDLFRTQSHQIAHELTCLWNSFQDAIITDIRTIFQGHIFGSQTAEHTLSKLHLFFGRTAPGHI